MSNPLEKAYNDGREAWYSGEECPSYFVVSLETKVLWEAGFQAQRRADPHKLDAVIMREYDVTEV